MIGFFYGGRKLLKFGVASPLFAGAKNEFQKMVRTVDYTGLSAWRGDRTLQAMDNRLDALHVG